MPRARAVALRAAGPPGRLACGFVGFFVLLVGVVSFCGFAARGFFFGTVRFLALVVALVLAGVRAVVVAARFFEALVLEVRFVEAAARFAGRLDTRRVRLDFGMTRPSSGGRSRSERP